MRTLLVIFAAVVAFAQPTTPLKVSQSAGSAAGAVWLQEPRADGTSWLKMKAPALSSDVDFTLPPTTGTSGQCLTTDGSGVTSWAACTGERTIADYDWSQVVGARSGSGTLTLTFTGTSCPAAGTDAAYVARVYETVTPTTYEIGQSNGTGSCARGGSGTIVLTGITGTYTNATATSASGGAQEAIFSVADSLAISLRANDGAFYVYSDILTEDRNLTLTCQSPNTQFIPMQAGVKVFSVSAPSAARIYNCGFSNYTGLYANTTGIYFNNPDGSTYGGRIQGNELSYFNDSIHLVTAYLVDIIGNRVIQADNAAIWIENVDTGDAGIGLVAGNNLSCVTTCAHGLLWNSPGALQFKFNGLNGFTEQVTLDPHHGYASAADSGADTVLTWVSGNRFRSAMVGYPVQIGDTQSCTVTTYTSSTSVTCAGVNLGTITNQRYYHGGTGQVQIFGNLLDGFTNTTHGVRWLGGIFLFNAQIEQNFVANYNNTTAKAISIEGSGARILSIKNNNVSSAYNSGWTTVGIDVTASSDIHIEGNQISGYVTGINTGASALTLQVEGNRILSSTTPFTSGASTALYRESTPITYAQLMAMTVANGSTFVCSDCKATSASSATCATGGTGAQVARINSVWVCTDGTAGTQWTVSGSDVYRAAGKVGVGITAPLAPLDVFGTSASPATTGTATTAHARIGGNATNALDIGTYSGSPFGIWLQGTNVTALGTTYPMYLNPTGGMVDVANGIGRYSSAAFSLRTDNTDRWTITSAGMLNPATTDTVSIGDLTTPKRVLGIYPKILDTALSGGTGDYIQTRKIQLFDNTGSSTGASFWDLNVVMSGVGAGQNSYFYLRDNGGANVFKSERIASGAAVDRTLWYTDLQPDTHQGQKLGVSGTEWNELWVKDIWASGTVTATGNLSGAVINATGSPAYRVSGTTVINASRAATFTDLTINTSAAPAVGDVWTATSTGGAGSWQTPSSGQWTTSGSNIYRGTGVVTIGHTSPSTRLGENLSLDASSDFAGMAINTWSATGGHGGIIDFNKSASATKGTQAAVASGDTLGFFVFRGSDGTAFQRAAEVDGEVDAAVSSGIIPGRLRFRTSDTSGTMTERLKIDSAGLSTFTGSVTVTSLLTGATINATGSPAYRVSGTTVINASRDATFVGLTTSGAVSLASSTITASSTFSSDIIATTGSTYALGSSSVRWLGYFSTANVSGVLTLSSTITGDLIPTSNNTYINGSSTNYWNQIAGETIYVENSGRIRPRTGNTGSVGGSAILRFNKGWFTDMDMSGTITAPNGNAGVSATKTVRDSAGTGTCTLIFSGGLLTGGTC